MKKSHRFDLIVECCKRCGMTRVEVENVRAPCNPDPTDPAFLSRMRDRREMLARAEAMLLAANELCGRTLQ